MPTLEFHEWWAYQVNYGYSGHIHVYHNVSTLVLSRVDNEYKKSVSNRTPATAFKGVDF